MIINLEKDKKNRGKRKENRKWMYANSNLKCFFFKNLGVSVVLVFVFLTSKWLVLVPFF